MTKTKELDLNAFDVEELLAIAENAQELIEKKRQQRLLNAYKQFEKIAEDCHSSINDILAAGEQLEKKRSIRYRHPEDTELTWTGRGRKPTWVVDALESGKTLEDFYVDDDALI